ncbi:MAG: RsiV family protein, partial [Devosia sp.]
FSSEGLEITYQPYEVTAYAFGAPKITLSWTELTPYLKAGAMELVY